MMGYPDLTTALQSVCESTRVTIDNPYLGSQNRRRCPRLAVDIPVKVGAGRAQHDGLLTDLGIGGLFAQVEFTPSVGVKLAVLVEFESSTVRLPVIVRWVDARGFGAQFDLLGPRESQVVAALISEARPKPGS